MNRHSKGGDDEFPTGRFEWVPKIRPIQRTGASIGVLIVLVSVILAAEAAIRRWTTELAITSSRIINKRGLVVRKTIEINRSKVESVQVDQGILGRILDFGTVAVRGTGGGFESIKALDSPLEFRRYIGDVAATKP